MTVQLRAVRRGVAVSTASRAIKVYDLFLCGLLAVLRLSNCIRPRHPRRDGEGALPRLPVRQPFR